jgi:hypothetical protein
MPERRMDAKGWAAITKAEIFSEIVKQTPMFARSSEWRVQVPRRLPLYRSSIMEAPKSAAGG